MWAWSPWCQRGKGLWHACKYNHGSYYDLWAARAGAAWDPTKPKLDEARSFAVDLRNPTPLVLALSRGACDVVQVLLRDPRVTRDVAHMNVAFGSGCGRCVALLLEAGFVLTVSSVVAFLNSVEGLKLDVVRVVLTSCEGKQWVKTHRQLPGRVWERAVKSRDPRMTDLLVNAGIEPTQRAWKAAGRFRNLSVLQEFEMSYRETFPELGCYSFVEAARRGYGDVVLFLIGKHVPPDCLSNGAILSAAEHGQVAMVQLLLQYPCLNVPSVLNAALVKAAKRGHLEVVKMLTERFHANPKIALEGTGFGHNEVLLFLFADPRSDGFECNWLHQAVLANAGSVVVNAFLNRVRWNRSLLANIVFSGNVQLLGHVLNAHLFALADVSSVRKELETQPTAGRGGLLQNALDTLSEHEMMRDKGKG